MPVQIDMEMPEDCEVCPASQWVGAYCREDSTFCPLLTEHHEKDGKRNPNCPLIKTEDSTWHVVAEGDLPPKLKDGERAKTYLITKNDTQKYIDFAFWDGEAFGRERKCNIVVSGVLAWRELPEPWEGVSEQCENG